MAVADTAPLSFTAGETVSAYLNADTTLAAATTATAAGDGSVSFPNLLDDKVYLLVGGTSGRSVRVFTAVPGDGSHSNLPGMLAPEPIWFSTPTTGSLGSANTAWLSRVTAQRDMTISAVSFDVTTADGTDPAVDVGIYDVQGNRLGSSGPVTGQLTSGGLKPIPLTAPVEVKAGVSYYLAISSPSTVWAMRVVSIGSGSTVNRFFGADMPYQRAGAVGTAHPLPANIGTALGVLNGAAMLAALI